MAYTETEKALAIEIVNRNDGVLDSNTLNAIRAAIGQVSAPTIRGWLKHIRPAEQNPANLPQKKKENLSEKISGDQIVGDEINDTKPAKSDWVAQNFIRQRAPAKVWDKAFLAELALTGVVSAACLTAQVDRRTVYYRRESDPEFKASWDEALELASDWLEKEARRRAENGTLKPVFYKGEIVGFEREYSDTLMTLLLKANRPDKFGDKLTLRLDPRQAAILARHNLTAGDAMEMLIQELDEIKTEVDASASTD